MLLRADQVTRHRVASRARSGGRASLLHHPRVANDDRRRSRPVRR